MSTNNQQPANHVRVSAGSTVRNLLRYAQILFKERNFREVRFTGLGGAIGKIVSTVEVLKVLNPGLWQQNFIETVTYSTKDNNNTLVSERLYPKMEVVLSMDKPSNTNQIGFQAVMNEEDRVKFQNLLNQRRENTGGYRSRGDGSRGRGGRGGRGRGGFGGRGRGGFRGGRGSGGFRGGYNNEERGYNSGERGGYNGGERGGRGGFRGRGGRGGRGAPRGEPRMDGGDRDYQPRGYSRGGMGRGFSRGRGGPSRGMGRGMSRGRGFRGGFRGN